MLAFASFLAEDTDSLMDRSAVLWAWLGGRGLYSEKDFLRDHSPADPVVRVRGR